MGGLGNKEDAEVDQDAAPETSDVMEVDVSPDLPPDMPLDEPSADPMLEDSAMEDIVLDPDVLDTTPEEEPPIDLVEEEYGVYGVVGDPCSAYEECLGVPTEARSCFNFLGPIAMPGGYCSAICLDNEECGFIGRCVYIIFLAAMKVCLKLCETDADCRADEGYSCQNIPLSANPNKFCMPPM